MDAHASWHGSQGDSIALIKRNLFGEAMGTEEMSQELRALAAPTEGTSAYMYIHSRECTHTHTHRGK